MLRQAQHERLCLEHTLTHPLALSLSKGAMTAALLLSSLISCQQEQPESTFPPGKSFAFAFIDESDKASLTAVRPVYDAFLASGFRSTIAVWTHEPVMDHTQEGSFDPRRTPGHGVSLEDEAWREYVRQLSIRGFEIASHSASSGDDTRDMMAESFRRHVEWFGKEPTLFTPHHYNLETPTSPAEIWSFPFSSLLSRTVGRSSEGNKPDSIYDWRNLLKRHVRYVKGWGAWDLNTIARVPGMPARSARDTDGPAWFACTNGYAPSRLPDLFSAARLETLAREGGIAIVCTHFSSFTEKTGSGEYAMRPFARDLIEWLARPPEAWVAPAGELLDTLAKQPGRHPPTWSEQFLLFVDGFRNYLFLNKPWTRRYLSAPDGS